MDWQVCDRRFVRDSSPAATHQRLGAPEDSAVHHSVARGVGAARWRCTMAKKPLAQLVLATLDCHLERGASGAVGLVGLGAGGEKVERHRHRTFRRDEEERHLYSGRFRM
jgi:hypothetical protein